ETELRSMSHIKILTERKYNIGISRQTVYEWEEDTANYFQLDYEYMNSYKRYPFARIMRKLKIPAALTWIPKRDIKIFFAMNTDLVRLLAWTNYNVVPIILDISLNEIDELYKLTRKLPVFWVTASKIKDALVKKYPDCKCRYIP